MVGRFALLAFLVLGVPALGQTRPANSDGAAPLTPVFTFHMPEPGGYGGTVAASGGLLFVQTPFPHTIYAFDLARPADPVRWRRSPEADRMALGQDCCGTIDGGPVLAGDRLYLNTFDGHTMALDAATGAVAWDVRTADPAQGETLRDAPTVLGSTVFLGSAGDDFGARGWIEALDATTGRTIWRRFDTGPDADVGIQRGQDLGAATWPPDGWRQGGGSARGLLFDTTLGLLIHATGHPAPWNPGQRDGDNRWTSGLFARDPATGTVRWFTPINPHDLFALGAGPSNLQADTPDHHLLLHPDGNGYVYVLDRATGGVLSAVPFVPVNQRNDAKDLHQNRVTRDICPGWPGATGPGRAAYAQDTGLLYIPASLLCMDMEARNASYVAGTPFMGANLRLKPPGGNRGALIAWDVAAAKPAWTMPERFPLVGGVLATGGLVIYGTLDGWLRALDARTGAVRFQYQADTGIIGTPAVVAGPDGRQYLAALAGAGGGLGRVALHSIDIRDATAAHGAANALRDLPPQETPGGTLYVFALP